jgi:hypothetical protein
MDKKIFDGFITKFKLRTSNCPYRLQGMLLHEAFAICALTNHRGCNVLINSGVFSGRSTEIFINALDDTRIMAIDKDLKESTIKMIDEQIFKTTCRIEWREGNDIDQITYVLKYATPTDMVCLSLDSTKGHSACRMAKTLWEQYPQIKVMALHDQRCNNYPMKKYFDGVLFTDDDWFWKTYGSISLNDISHILTIGKYKDTFVTEPNFKGFVTGIVMRK